MDNKTHNAIAATTTTTTPVFSPAASLEDVKDDFHSYYQAAPPGLLILLETFPHFAEELKEEYFRMKKYNAYFKEIVVG